MSDGVSSGFCLNLFAISVIEVCVISPGFASTTQEKASRELRSRILAGSKASQGKYRLNLPELWLITCETPQKCFQDGRWRSVFRRVCDVLSLVSNLASLEEGGAGSFRAVRVSPSVQTTEVENGLREDARWQLIERILATGPFQKSGRLRELLPYMAERAIHGHSHELTEHNIGVAVFGKPPDYSPVEDSSVRVHARQLRLKLHEYFDGEGRGERMIVEIPKGSYVPVFRSVKSPSAEPLTTFAPALSVSTPKERHDLLGFIPWAVAALLAIACVFLSVRLLNAPPQPAPVPWPLSSVFDGVNRTQIVIADVNYGMLRIASQQQGSLEEYLRPDMLHTLTPDHLSAREARIMNYIAGSNLTSYADVVVITTLSNMVPSHRGLVSVRSARDLRLRDLQDGNYIFVGSPSSNPWVVLYENKLNFREAEGVVGESMKYFVNEHPNPGEQQTYQGLEFTGSAGQDYATISLLPTANGRGSVLILQGLQQEATEAAGLFLANEQSRAQLRKALGITESPAKPLHFEVLISTRAVAGAPNATSIVAARLLP